ncbi:uncharacterized protein LOC125939839 [Dermacentor silvarum]|uniref:uncharacterized protein LOC125939839 n=1 Tax=Dermacentor silvarum TaxID=543639 RepID=UPI002100F4F1|nr:uncharacterized protein LOC125939839 [Dermacentor silvarum]
MESGADDKHVNIGRMASKLYSVCVQDQHNNSPEVVRESLKEMLRSAGINEWPLIRESYPQYEKVLEKTGLRPVATIAPVPHPQKPQYMLAVNAPLPRFAAYPDAMVKISKRRKMREAYKNLIRVVLNLFCETQSDKVEPTTSSNDDAYDYSSSNEEHSSVVEESQNDAEKETVIEQIISDIIDVEVNIAKMIINGRVIDYYQTDTVQNWQKRLGSFPFLAGLAMDLTRANRTLKNNYEVGLHLFNYFKNLAKYLESLEV